MKKSKLGSYFSDIEYLCKSFLVKFGISAPLLLILVRIHNVNGKESIFDEDHSLSRGSQHTL